MVFGYLPSPYMDIEPVSEADGRAASPGSDAIPLWAWAAVAGALVVGWVLVSRIRRAGEDERE
jgi:hypothetical protein